jgi:KDO2-lipid IV(A) lauroyltransferase
MLNCVDYICAKLARLFNLAFHILPTGFALWLGRRLGSLIYLINTTRRAIGYANLKAAFSEEKTPRQLRRLIKGVYKSLTQVFFEILTLTKVDEKYVEKYIEIVNPQNMLGIKDHPNGIILLTAHFGNWELSGMVSAIKGFPPIVLAREQKMKNLNGLINRLRESKGLKVVTKGITTRYIVKALHAGKIIGMVGDQDAGKTGELVEFFGRLASTAPGSARIAQKTAAYIVPAFIARVKGPRHKLTLEKPIRIKKGEDIKPYLSRYNKLLEKYVRMYPEQWLWLHKRWKSTPLKKVTIISDGKEGHTSQARALAGLLKKYRADSGYSASDTKEEVVEVRFRSKFRKRLLSFLALFSGSRCQGCMKCLKACLTKNSYDNLMSRYSDIVMGAGSGTAAVNRFFSVENNAKSAHVLKPSILGFKKFDMVVVPAHDGIKTRDEGRLIATDTTLNLMDEEYLTRSASELKRVVPSSRRRKIGVLLGGNNSDFMLTEDIAEELLNNVINAANKLDAEFFFTTSRRTPGSIEKITKARLRPEKRCKLLVIPNEKNMPHAAAGVLGLADVVVVSGESASMVSEAVASKKRVVVFGLKKKKKKASKFERMLKNMEEKGFLITSKTGEVSDGICRSFNMPPRKKMPEDNYNVYKYMWRLL